MKTVLAVAAIVAVADQAAKAVVTAALRGAPPVVVVPKFFDICLVFNEGAAWGIMAGKRLLLVGVSLAFLAFIASCRRELAATRLGRNATGLMCGGIVGNFIDRALRGKVVDFLDFHVGSSWSWPAFNIADAAICTGVGLLLLQQALQWYRERHWRD